MRRALRNGLIAAGFFVVASAPAGAQDAVDAGMLVWQNNGCSNCHGEFGEGGEGGHFPAGPALRRSSLAREHLRETVGCGRPGTEMPSNLKGAYISVPCYGLPLAAAMPPGTLGGVAMSEADLDKLVEYLMARVIGKGTNISKAECVAYYGDPNYAGCAGMR